MNPRIASCLVASLLFIITFITPTGAKLTAERLVVHEWGTFTTLAGADGALQMWRPLGGASELPNFVYSSYIAKQDRQTGSYGVKCQTFEQVRKEKPVI